MSYEKTGKILSNKTRTWIQIFILSLATGLLIGHVMASEQPVTTCKWEDEIIYHGVCTPLDNIYEREQ